MSDYKDIPISGIKTRPDLFQYRQDNDGPVDKATVDRLARRWDWGRYDPIDVAPDPERPGEYIVIAGHHRATAAGQLGAVNPGQARPNLSVRVLEGDIRQPEDLDRMVNRAIDSNYAIRRTSLLADAGVAKKWAGEGATPQEIAERMSENRPSRVRDLLAFGELHKGDQQFVETVPDFYPAAAELESQSRRAKCQRMRPAVSSERCGRITKKPGTSRTAR